MNAEDWKDEQAPHPKQTKRLGNTVHLALDSTRRFGSNSAKKESEDDPSQNKPLTKVAWEKTGARPKTFSPFFDRKEVIRPRSGNGSDRPGNRTGKYKDGQSISLSIDEKQSSAKGYGGISEVRHRRDDSNPTDQRLRTRNQAVASHGRKQGAQGNETDLVEGKGETTSAAENMSGRQEVEKIRDNVTQDEFKRQNPGLTNIKENVKEGEYTYQKNKHNAECVRQGENRQDINDARRANQPHLPQIKPKKKKPEFIRIDVLFDLKMETPFRMAKRFEKLVNDLEYSIKQIKEEDVIEFYPWITELIQILAMVTGGDFDLLPRVVGCLQRSHFFDSTLAPYLAILQVDWDKTAQTVLAEVNDVTSLLGSILKHMPSSSVSILGIDIIAKGVLRRPDVAKLLGGSSNLYTERVDEIGTTVKDIIIQRSERRNAFGSHDTGHDPPQNPTEGFREIDVYPSSEELLSPKEPFLRKNIVDGPYDSIEHYLDIQYRLLREDFVRPLRQGITKIVSALKELKHFGGIDNVRIYRDARVVSSVFTSDGLGYRLLLPHLKFRNLEACDRSKRLIYGSFLCLSNDDFKTLIFATVANRVSRDLMRGIIEISIIQRSIEETVNLELEHKRFVMVESEAFFEAYKHVLTALKTFRALPFENHIVACESEVKPPAYVQEESETGYDFSAISDPNAIITPPSPQEKKPTGHCQKLVKPFDPEAWPTAEELKLDTSQFAALRTALTKEFVVTQGPPGTGKTYIGLQITKVLLSHQLNNDRKTPILVVCYTNHALDQFLEGIGKFFKGGIIRVGGRSSNETLAQYRLNDVREKYRKDRKIPFGIYDERKNAKDKMVKLSRQINMLRREIERFKSEVCYNFDPSPYLTDCQMKFLQKGLFGILLNLQRKNELNSCTNIFQIWLQSAEAEASDEGNPERDLGEKEPNFMVSKQDEATSVEELVEVSDQVKRVCADRETDDIDIELVKETSQFTQGESIETGTVLHIERTDAQNNAEWSTVDRKSKKKNFMFRGTLQGNSQMSEKEAKHVDDVWKLSKDDRVRLYLYWQVCHLQNLEMAVNDFVEAYMLALTEYKRARMSEDVYILRNSSVIGMTTTGAARCQEILFTVAPKIVIVEEAAEVLESHIITTLSNNTEHLILIGDHEQLRPNPTTYELARHYHLDVSFFERMIHNGIPSDCLLLQHRMRPEISKLLRHIYPDLRDHESVLRYEQIKGVSKSFYFICHSELESRCKDNDGEEKSHWNAHEGRYAVALCKFMIQQGYSPEKITVLTTYSAQLFYLKGLMPKEEFEGVHVTVVDNYQGEENDIVILSLVRSNTEGKIGFLKIKNRICVAMSRAKMGFYVIGNFSFLRKHSPLWEKMVQTMEEQNQIGSALELHCQRHPEFVIRAETAEDFAKSPEGGCTRPCEARLDCGHSCTRKCHSYDPDHQAFQCMKSCTKTCERGHACKLKCYIKCKCTETVMKELQCKHNHEMPCYLKPEEFFCQVSCSHELACGHTVSFTCCERPDQFKCQAACVELLKCGHPCLNKCGEKHTESCEVLVKNELPCGHTIEYQCGQSEKKNTCTKMCELTLECGHSCRKRCGQRCTRHCKQEVEKLFECGHKGQVQCYSFDLASCQMPCQSWLSCGHKCQGMCTLCAEGRFHKACEKCRDCYDTLICRHDCNAKAGACQLCEHRCAKRCPHLICQHPCYEPCFRSTISTPVTCTRPCEWICSHNRCTMKCNELCNRQPCNRPCPETAPCGHDCSGYCGEPCPPCCITCMNKKDQRKVYGLFDANGKMFNVGQCFNKATRYIFLEDCGHIIEASAMEEWMQNWSTRPDQDGMQVFTLPFCPIPNCRARICTNRRYNNIIRTAEKEFDRIKEKNCHSMPRSHKHQAEEVIRQLDADIQNFDRDHRAMVESPVSALKDEVERKPNWFKTQEIDDFNKESKRITLLMQLCALKESQKTNDQSINEVEHVLKRGRFNKEKQRLLNEALVKDGAKNLQIKYRFLQIKESAQFSPLHVGSWVRCGKGHLSPASEVWDGKTCPNPQCHNRMEKAMTSNGQVKTMLSREQPKNIPFTKGITNRESHSANKQKGRFAQDRFKGAKKSWSAVVGKGPMETKNRAETGSRAEVGKKV